VWLTAAMRRVLAACPAGDGPYVITGKKFPISKNNRDKDDVAANLTEPLAQPWTINDLRRSFRTGCSRIKIAPHIAELYRNHKGRGEEETYNRHDFAEEMRDAWARWSAHIEPITR